MALSDKSSRSVVLAILGGSGLIAAAIYLRPRADAVATSPVTQASANEAGGAASARRSAGGAELANRDFELRVAQQVRLAMERQRSIYSERCWLPAQKDGGSKQAVYAVTVSIDETGHEVGREISGAPRQPSRADVLACLRGLDGVAVTIPAPEKPMKVTVEYNFP